MFVAYGYVLTGTHFGQQIQKIAQGQCLAGSGLTPDRQMTGMVASQNRSEMATEFMDLAIADIGVEYFFEHCQLLGPYELLIIQETPILYDRTADHMLDLVEDPRADIGWFHWKITSICVHWKYFYKNVSVMEPRSARELHLKPT
jgi:hypothetical protein